MPPAPDRNAETRPPPVWYARFGRHRHPLIPELQSLGRGSIALVRSDRAGRRVGGRFHEICSVLRGSDECRIAGQLHRIGPGEMLIAPPEHEFARIFPRSAAGEVCWLSLDLRSGAGSLDSSIAAALDRHALRVIQAPRRLPALFDRLLAEHQNADAHSVWAARGALHCLLAEILRSYEAAPPADSRPPPSEAIAAAIAIIEERVAEKLPIARRGRCCLTHPRAA